MGRFNNKMPVFRKDAQPSSAAIKPGERKMDFHYAVDEQQVPRSINITLPEYLSFDHDIQDIANEIIKQTTDICIPIERRLNRLAKHYLKVKGTEYVSFTNNYPPLGDVNVYGT